MLVCDFLFVFLGKKNTYPACWLFSNKFLLTWFCENQNLDLSIFCLCFASFVFLVVRRNVWHKFQVALRQTENLSQFNNCLWIRAHSSYSKTTKDNPKRPKHELNWQKLVASSPNYHLVSFSLPSRLSYQVYLGKRIGTCKRHMFKQTNKLNLNKFSSVSWFQFVNFSWNLTLEKEDTWNSWA